MMRCDDGRDFRAGFRKEFIEQARRNVEAREIERKREESYKKAREKERLDKIIEYCQPKIVEILGQAIDVFFQKYEEQFGKIALQTTPGTEPITALYARIERRLCAVFHVTPNEIYSHRRKKESMLARQAVMYWTVRLTGYSYPKIGRIMGERDHTTIINGAKAYRQKREKMGRYLRKAR